MRTIPLAVLLSLTLLPAAVPAAAQTRAASPAAPPARPGPAPAAPTTVAGPSGPQQTTASFMDWTLRCSRLGPPPGTQFCEVAQGIQREDKPVAQIAIGRPGKGQPTQLTILVPVNVTVAAAAALAGPGEGTAAVQELTWRRCLPGGCTADGLLTDEAVQRMRAWNEPGRVTFQDALGRPAVLPFSPRGLAQALDALAKEEGN